MMKDNIFKIIYCGGLQVIYGLLNPFSMILRLWPKDTLILKRSITLSDYGFLYKATHTKQLYHINATYL